jgi:phosphoenolpyruvate phosphomutase
VPTTYYGTPTEVLRRAGISVVIWANHLVRASVAAMQRIARRIHDAESLVEVEGQVAPVRELFRLQGADELLAAEKLYTRSGQPRPVAVILAASRGAGLEALTHDRPKVMLPIAGKPLLRRLVDRFKSEGVHEICVVAGYKAEAIDVQGVKLVESREYECGGELTSLACARAHVAGDAIVLYGDLLFRDYMLRELVDATAPLTVVVDSAPLPERGNRNDLAWCSAPDGRWIGMLRARGEGAAWLLGALAELEARPDFARLGMPELLNHLVERGRAVAVQYVHGHWLDVNDLDDLERANAFAHGSLD